MKPKSATVKFKFVLNKMHIPGLETTIANKNEIHDKITG
jgi:hypothetical protein